MVFVDEFIADHTQIRSVLDYSIEIRWEGADLWLDDEANPDVSLVRALPASQQNYVALTGNYSVAGFEMTLRRKVSFYS